MMKKGSQRKLQEGQQQQEGQCRVRPKVLCLGVSYPCIEQSAKQAGVSLPQSVIAAASSSSLLAKQQQQDITTTKSRNAGGIFTSSNDRLLPSIENDNNNNNNINNDIKQITNIIQECVQSNILTQMDGRDLIRCLITERVCHVDIYTVSQECGAIYNNQRHLHANFNRSNFVSKLNRHFSGDNNNSKNNNSSALVLFDQIILDYYWIPLGWDTEHWTRTFFAKVLIDLCNVLQPNHGVIYLPFCLHCLKQVLVCRYILTNHYNISFVRRKRNKPEETTTTSSTRDGDDVNGDDNEVEDNNESIEQIYLWKGTQQINAKIMQGVFGKRLNQEEIYCTFGPRNLSEDMEDVAISKANVLDTCKRLEDFHDIRFIALRRIPHHVVHEQLDDDSSVVDDVDDNNVVDVTPPSSSSSSSSSTSSSVRYASSDPATSVPAVPVTALPLTQQPRQPHGSLVSRRRIVPSRTCRQPKSAIFNKPSPPPSAVKKVLFPSKNKVGRPKKKHKNNNNTIRGSILGLQDPRTIQRGFFSSSTSSITAANIISSGGGDKYNNSFAMRSIRSSATTSNTTTRVVTPTPPTGRSKIFKELDDDDDVKKAGKRRRLSPLPLSSIQDGDDDEMAKKPKALF